MIDLNITTMMALTQHYGRLMRERHRGGILLVGSMSGYLGSVRHPVYGGVKAYGRIFAEGLWLGLNFGVPGMRVVAREGLEQRRLWGFSSRFR